MDRSLRRVRTPCNLSAGSLEFAALTMSFSCKSPGINLRGLGSPSGSSSSSSAGAATGAGAGADAVAAASVALAGGAPLPSSTRDAASGAPGLTGLCVAAHQQTTMVADVATAAALPSAMRMATDGADCSRTDGMDAINTSSAMETVVMRARLAIIVHRRRTNQGAPFGSPVVSSYIPREWAAGQPNDAEPTQQVRGQGGTVR